MSTRRSWAFSAYSGFLREAGARAFICNTIRRTARARWRRRIARRPSLGAARDHSRTSECEPDQCQPTVVLFRVALLRYISRSARSIACSSRSKGESIVAPIETVAWMRLSRTGTEHSAMSCRQRSARSFSIAGVTSASMATNSSPPQRPTTSFDRRLCRRVSEIVWRTTSPTL